MTRSALTADGTSVAYDVFGAGPALILVHGLGDDRSLWSPVVERLSGSYACVTLDLRGHGETTGAVDFDPFGLDRDIGAVVRDLGLERPALVGHSLGGFAVSVYASRAPCAAVVNVDQPMDLRPLAARVRGLRRDLEGPVDRVLLSVLEGIGLGALPSTTVERLRATRARLARDAVFGLWGPLLNDDDDVLDARVSGLLERISAPYLSLHGEPTHDGYRQWLESKVDRTDLEVWTGAGHFLHLTQRDRFADRVLQFLAHVAAR